MTQSNNSHRASGIALALISASAFASLGLFAKYLFAYGMSVQQALAWRFTVASAILWIWSLATGRHKRPARDYRSAVLLGLFGFAPQAGLYFVTVKLLGPGLTGLLLYLYPAFVVVMGSLFLRKRPVRAQLIALILSTAGCVLTLWTRGQYPAAGYILGVLVALTYAAYLVAGERVLAKLDPVFATTVLMSAAAIVYWSITLATNAFSLPSQPSVVAAVLGIAAFGTVVPIVMLFAAMARIGAADTSLVSTVEPLVTIALSAAIFGDRLSLLQLGGGALILAAVVVIQLEPVLDRARQES